MRFNPKLILSLLITIPSALAAVNGACSNGKKGICIATGTCTSYGGKTSNGNCPNDPNNIKCCSNIPCKASGKSGTCMFTSECTNGTTYSNLCPGGSNFKCCVKKPTPTTSTGVGAACTSESIPGKCIDTNKTKCGTTLVTGKCPGAANVKCCLNKNPPTDSTIGKPGTVRTIPNGLGNVFSHMGWQMITSPSSNQYKLRQKYGQKFNNKGFGVINGMYVVAVTTWYGNVGDVLKVEFANGQKMDAVIGDIKNQNDAGCNKYGHMDGKCVIEFVVDKTGGFGGYNGSKTATSEIPWLKNNRVTKITNVKKLPY